MALDQINNGKAAHAVTLAEPGPHRRLAFITRLNYARVNDVRLLSEIFRQALAAADQSRS